MISLGPAAIGSFAPQSCGYGTGLKAPQSGHCRKPGTEHAIDAFSVVERQDQYPLLFLQSRPASLAGLRGWKISLEGGTDKSAG
jgi:hypothetical protein